MQADVTHVPWVNARNPGWHVFYDQDAAMAEATRRKVYDMLVAEKMMVQGFHYPFPSLAYVEKSRRRLSGSHGAVESDDLISRRSTCERVARGRLRAASCRVMSRSTERDRAG